jgi:hypothetical protein
VNRGGCRGRVLSTAAASPAQRARSDGFGVGLRAVARARHVPGNLLSTRVVPAGVVRRATATRGRRAAGPTTCRPAVGSTRSVADLTWYGQSCRELLRMSPRRSKEGRVTATLSWSPVADRDADGVDAWQPRSTMDSLQVQTPPGWNGTRRAACSISV